MFVYMESKKYSNFFLLIYTIVIKLYLFLDCLLVRLLVINKVIGQKPSTEALITTFQKIFIRVAKIATTKMFPFWQFERDHQ